MKVTSARLYDKIPAAEQRRWKWAVPVTLRGAVRTGATDMTTPHKLETTKTGLRQFQRWLLPAVSVALAAGLAWSAVVDAPALRRQIAAVSADRDLLRRALETANAATPPVALEANVPMVILTSGRAGGDIPMVTLTNDAKHFLVVVDGPSSPSGTAQLAISANSAAAVTTIRGLTRGTNGVWTVSLPNQSYPDAIYRVRLSDDTPDGALLGDYLLKITRR